MTTDRKQQLRAGSWGATLALAGMLGVTTGCRTNESPVLFTVTVPEPNHVEMEAELTGRYGLGLDAELQIHQYGTLFVRPETLNDGFRFGFNLHTGAFLRESWVNYREVTALPTGAPFPSWMTTAVVDVVVPPLDGVTPGVGWHFYAGTRGKLYVGIAAIIAAIDGRFPAVNLGYTFYDRQGRVVLGLLFFGPSVVNGQLRSPGGIFVGTDLTPFLPAELQPGSSIASAELGLGSKDGGSSGRALNARAAALALRALDGPIVTADGRSLASEIRVGGRDAGRYRSERSIRRLIGQYARASRGE